MSNLNDQDRFQILNGWTPGDTSANTRTYNIADNGGSPYALEPGMIIARDASGNAVPAATPATAKQVYVVIEGNVVDLSTRSFSNTVDQVTSARGSLRFVTPRFTGAGFAINDPVSYDNGLLQAPAGGDQILGYVESYDATEGLLTVEVTL